MSYMSAHRDSLPFATTPSTSTSPLGSHLDRFCWSPEDSLTRRSSCENSENSAASTVFTDAEGMKQEVKQGPNFFDPGLQEYRRDLVLHSASQYWQSKEAADESSKRTRIPPDTDVDTERISAKVAKSIDSRPHTNHWKLTSQQTFVKPSVWTPIASVSPVLEVWGLLAEGMQRFTGTYGPHLYSRAREEHVEETNSDASALIVGEDGPTKASKVDKKRRRKTILYAPKGGR